MTLSHKTFASAMRVVASDSAPLYEPTVRDMLRTAADKIEHLLDVIDDYERARLYRLGGIGGPE